MFFGRSQLPLAIAVRRRILPCKKKKNFKVGGLKTRPTKYTAPITYTIKISKAEISRSGMIHPV